MRKLLIAILLFSLSPISHAQMGGFNSLSEPEQQVLEAIVHYLGISDENNRAKMKIYNEIDYIFDTDGWNSYYNHLNELKLSNFSEELGKGYITMSFNTSSSGLFMLNFIHKPEAEQIFLDVQQIRYGSRTDVLAVYTATKDNEEYEAIHDTDTHALLKRTGYMTYEYFNIGSGHGEVLYRDFKIIQL